MRVFFIRQFQLRGYAYSRFVIIYCCPELQDALSKHV